MIILVTGGRDFDDYQAVERRLERHDHAKPYLIHGGARGADTLCGLYGESRGWKVAVMPADWEKHGKAAGPRRNEAMVRRAQKGDAMGHGPVVVEAFAGGSGTADMVARCRAVGFEVRES